MTDFLMAWLECLLLAVAFVGMCILTVTVVVCVYIGSSGWYSILKGLIDES